jgi:hypothetical protein
MKYYSLTIIAGIFISLQAANTTDNVALLIDKTIEYNGKICRRQKPTLVFPDFLRRKNEHYQKQLLGLSSFFFKKVIREGSGIKISYFRCAKASSFLSEEYDPEVPIDYTIHDSINCIIREQLVNVEDIKPHSYKEKHDKSGGNCPCSFLSDSEVSDFKDEIFTEESDYCAIVGRQYFQRLYINLGFNFESTADNEINEAYKESDETLKELLYEKLLQNKNKSDNIKFSGFKVVSIFSPYDSYETFEEKDIEWKDRKKWLSVDEEENRELRLSPEESRIAAAAQSVEWKLNHPKQLLGIQRYNLGGKIAFGKGYTTTFKKRDQKTFAQMNEQNPGCQVVKNKKIKQKAPVNGFTTTLGELFEQKLSCQMNKQDFEWHVVKSKKTKQREKKEQEEARLKKQQTLQLIKDEEENRESRLSPEESRIAAAAQSVEWQLDHPKQLRKMGKQY